jgi:NAD-dependent dihydropyrimidine dehydrogenase PreA subunit
MRLVQLSWANLAATDIFKTFNQMKCEQRKIKRMKIVINYEKCSPCPDLKCVDNCPWGVFQVGKDKKPLVWDAASCIECGICENICPNNAIKVKRERKNFSSVQNINSL